MIPEETIEHIRQSTDIVQIIGEYIRLKKRGRNHLALCPFHKEKTPSFSVSQDKQIFHCFGCGKGGNVFSFLMEHEKMTFVESVRHLARKANIQIQEERGSDARREQLEKHNFANQVALDYFSRLLRSPKYKNILEDYLMRRRGISEEMIELFQLGLSGQEWDGLLRYARSKDLTDEDLEAAGLVLKSEKKGNYFDRFRQRLMIPIFNLSQRPIAFGGRTLTKGEPAKYVNSPETALYTKGNVLYGLNFARDAIRDSREAFVVEGYFDVISLRQIGIANVVASSGTAFTSQQARLLARFAELVYLFFDSDSAGQTAALRSVDALYDAGLDVKVIVGPTGEDPDSLAREQGAEAILRLTDQALDFIEFRVRDLDLKELGIVGKEKLIKELAAIGGKIADATRRKLFWSEAASALKIDPDLMMQPKAKEPPPVESTDANPRHRYNPVEYELLSLMFSSPGDIDVVFERISPEDFDSKELSRVFAAVANQYSQEGFVSASALTERMQDAEFVSLITAIAAEDKADDEISAGATQLVERMLGNKRKRIRARLRQELSEAEAAGDTEKAARIATEIRDILE